MNWNIFKFRKYQEQDSIIKSGGDKVSFNQILQQEKFEQDDLVTRKGLEIYRKMRTDDQVRACSDLKKTLILSSGWKILGDNKEQVDFIQSNLDRLPKPFGKKLKNIMTAYDYGFSVTEIVYQFYDGKIWVKNLKTLQPFNIDFEFDQYGNVTGVKVGYDIYPLDKFIVYSFSDEFENPYGTSDLRSAYPAYFFKQIVWKFWAAHLEGFGSPLIVGKIPPSASKSEKEAFEEIINNIHFKTSILLPRSQTTKEEFGIELIESKREGGSQFKDAINNADERIVRALLFPRLFGLTGEKFGSYALGRSQFNIVYSVLEELQRELEEEINRQLIWRLLSLNFPEPDTTVRISFVSPNKEKVQEMVEAYLTLIKEGLIDKTEETSNKIKGLLDME